MQFLNKMERKYGKYAIKNLITYVIGLYVTGIVITVISPGFYTKWLMLDFDRIASGEIWRLVTFLIQSPGGISIFLLFTLYLYYMIGTSLENAWGAFRFNLYFFSGVLFNILASIIIYLVEGRSIALPLDYVNQAMFFAYASLYPNVQLLLMYVIPIKIKYIAYIYAIFLAYSVYNFIGMGAWGYGLAVVVAMANFLIFFVMTRKHSKFSPQQAKRRENYKRQVHQAHNTDNVIQFNGKKVATRHKCAVCGRTELDDDSLEFRFCSKCDGNYEYCMEHLYTHEHVHKDVQ